MDLRQPGFCIVLDIVLDINTAKIQMVMDIGEVLLQWFLNVLIEKLFVALLKMKTCKTKN